MPRTVCGPIGAPGAAGGRCSAANTPLGRPGGAARRGSLDDPATADGPPDPGWARFAGRDSRVTRIRLGGLIPGDLTELAGALDWERYRRAAPVPRTSTLTAPGNVLR